MTQINEIQYEKATPELQSIFRDVQHILRFSDMPWLFRALGMQPAFLKAVWTAIKPTITDHFERSANDVRETAITQVNSLLPGSDLRAKLKKEGLKEETIDEICENVLAHHYVSPKLLLITTALVDALAERPASVDSIVVFPTGRGVPVGMPKINRVDAGNATSKNKEILLESAKLHGLDASTDLFLTLTQWPDALGTLWENLKPAIQSSKYAAVLSKIGESASEAAHHLRRRMDLGRDELALLGVSETERAESIKIITAAQKCYLAAVIDSAYFALSLAGPELAGLSGEALLIRWTLPRKG